MVALQRDHRPVDSVAAILSNSFIQQLKSDLARLQREESQLSESLGERHPTLLAKQTEVATTEQRLSAEITRVVDSIRNEYQAAVAEETSLTRALEDQKGRALALNRRGIEYAALEREAQSVRQVYQSLLQRAKETAVAGDLRSSNIRVVDPARTPRRPATPRKMYNIALGLAAGIVLAVALVFGLAYIDDRARTPDDVRRHVRLPVVGLIPEIRRSRVQLAPLLRPDAPPSLLEAVRAMRTGLVSNTAGPGPRSFVVTSASAGEGKSFVASSLAIALARTRQRVLLIDADLRRPRLHTLFEQPLEPGLSTILDGGAALGDVLRSTTVPGLAVMCAGRPTDRAPELLSSARFDELFSLLQSHFDWVIVDSPPVLSVTDASVVARKATGLFLVVASGRTTGAAARVAVDELRRAGAHVVGAVLSRADIHRHPYYFAPYSSAPYPADALDAPPLASSTLLGRSV
jgi:capsular exopolysaccharide synthesis family protein